MRLPEAALILGEGSGAAALSQVLGLLGCRCDRQLAVFASKTRRGSNSQRIKEPLTIALGQSTCNVEWVIPLVHALRTKNEWEGVFIAIVTDESQKATLAESRLTGDDSDVQYQHISGHAALARPLRLTALLRSISNTYGMYRGQWRNLLYTKTSLKQVFHSLERVKETRGGVDDQEMIGEAEKLCHSFAEVRWSRILTHSDAYRFQGLAESYLKKLPFSQECAAHFVAEVEEILL